MANEKYTGNRNQWRKAYPIGLPKRPPSLVTLTKIGIDGVTRNSTIDLNQTIRNRDAYRLSGDIASISGFGEYDEGLIEFNNETFKSFSYNFTFSSNPTVVFSIGSPASVDYTENINIYGISRNTGGGLVALSAPFSGSIRYRAAYASSYPSYFLGVAASISPTIGAFKASADVKVPDNVSYITASWGALDGIPGTIYSSPYDDYSNYNANVALAVSSQTAAGAIIEISAPISSSIYVLAIE